MEEVRFKFKDLMEKWLKPGSAASLIDTPNSKSSGSFRAIKAPSLSNLAKLSHLDTLQHPYA